MPFELELFAIVLCVKFYSPEWLWDELLYFFCLINTEAKSWGLARPIRDGNFLTCPWGSTILSTPSSSSAPATTSATRATTTIFARETLLELRGLKPGEGDTNLQIQDLPSINRDTLIEIWLIAKFIEGHFYVFVSN